MADVYIVSGFLGAGKTTWIQKMLAEAFECRKVALIENDFGKVSFDAAVLKQQGINVTEMNSGCICCSLSGNFTGAVAELQKSYAPEILIIEPSGVGKLSDVVRAVKAAGEKQAVRIAGSITIVDAKRFRLYMENFGEFFEDQIGHADVILLSHGQEAKEQMEALRLAVNRHNDRAAVFDASWDVLPVKEVLGRLPGGSFSAADPGEEQPHEEGCEEHHHHDAEEVFDSFTLSFDKAFAPGELEACFARMEAAGDGMIRAKGIVRGGDAWWQVQYVPGELRITSTKTAGGMITFIGRGVDERETTRIFGK